MFQLLQSIGAPKRFVVDDKVWGSENFARDGLIAFILEAHLDRIALHVTRERIAIDSRALRDVSDDIGITYVAVVYEIRAVNLLCKKLRQYRILVFQPIKSARRRDRHFRKFCREFHRDVEIARAARHVADYIIAFQRHLHRRHLAGLLENESEQNGMPIYLPVVLRGERVDMRRREVAIRRGEVEIKIDRGGQGLVIRFFRFNLQQRLGGKRAAARAARRTIAAR